MTDSTTLSKTELATDKQMAIYETKMEINDHEKMISYKIVA